MRLFILVITTLVLGMVAIRAADSIYDIKLQDIDGKDASLQPYQGKVLLLVNVASKCGFTPQYTGLEELYRKYKDRGLVVLGFPCNQFGEQEPGSNEEIKKFCSTRYQVSFPLWAKIEVNGPQRHPLYGLLAGESSPVAGDIRWNFTKFLVGRDGRILKRFESKAKPDSAEMAQAIEAALGKK